MQLVKKVMCALYTRNLVKAMTLGLPPNHMMRQFCTSECSTVGEAGEARCVCRTDRTEVSFALWDLRRTQDECDLGAGP